MPVYSAKRFRKHLGDFQYYTDKGVNVERVYDVLKKYQVTDRKLIAQHNKNVKKLRNKIDCPIVYPIMDKLFPVWFKTLFFLFSRIAKFPFRQYGKGIFTLFNTKKLSVILLRYYIL